MVKKLNLFLIICMIYSVNCIKLTEICKNNIFRYFNPYTSKYTVVNSFYKFNLLDKYPKIGDILLKTLEEPNFLNPKQLVTLHKTKSDYDDKLFEIFFNNKFIDLLNENRVNTFIPIFDKYTQARNNTLNILKELFVIAEHLIPKYIDQMDKFEKILLDVRDVKKNNQVLSDEFLPDDQLEIKFINLRSKLLPNQKPVLPFFKYREELYYSQPILEVSNFTIINSDNSKDITPDSRPNLDVFLVLPFNDSEYPTYTNNECTKRTKLPVFYRKRNDL